VDDSAGMASLKKPREHEMVIAMDCPWCESVVLTDESELDDGPLCEGCGVRFELAPDRPAEQRLADAA